MICYLRRGVSRARRLSLLPAVLMHRTVGLPLGGGVQVEGRVMGGMKKEGRRKQVCGDIRRTQPAPRS